MLLWDMWVDRIKLDTWVSNSLLNVSGEAGKRYRNRLSNREAVSTTKEIYNRKLPVFVV